MDINRNFKREEDDDIYTETDISKRCTYRQVLLTAEYEDEES